MKIIDAIKALKGDYAAEKEAHLLTKTQRDVASEALQPTKDALEDEKGAHLTTMGEWEIAKAALAPLQERAEAAEAVIAEAEKALGIEAIVEVAVPKVAPKK